ncbi:hypothetical protein SPSYN_01475 [Sporotomaculum syntrophicum]|uniref:Uncharacterized protein n=1 Tax=Sporotomaculum syntrophicum TaxID=182264 RepID=A0A9D2WQ69_9FIRM|nr:hypothetical protein SPSYN_01475 [Sporotomaculum syntrophicum]
MELFKMVIATSAYNKQLGYLNTLEFMHYSIYY